jgi:hypothetical protein
MLTWPYAEPEVNKAPITATTTKAVRIMGAILNRQNNLCNVERMHHLLQGFWLAQHGVVQIIKNRCFRFIDEFP